MASKAGLANSMTPFSSVISTASCETASASKSNWLVFCAATSSEKPRCTDT
ncbi:hypothetical protein D3C77_657330 [compost metagenome]